MLFARAVVCGQQLLSDRTLLVPPFAIYETLLHAQLKRGDFCVCENLGTEGENAVVSVVLNACLRPVHSS